MNGDLIRRLLAGPSFATAAPVAPPLQPTTPNALALCEILREICCAHHGMECECVDAAAYLDAAGVRAPTRG